MIEVPFDQTPLFQLNLMIFLGRPSVFAFVRPILYEEGFVLYLISPSTPTSLQNQARAANATPPIPFTPTPSPDLLFSQNKHKVLVPLECKRSSFGPNTEQARQAAALLSCTGSHLADILGLPTSSKWSAWLGYAVADSQKSNMQDTLLRLTTLLNSVSIETAPAGSLGIAVRTDGVYLTSEPRANPPVPTLKNAMSEAGVRVMELADDDDPRPLYLIPLDPSCRTGDEYEQRALEERVRIALASIVGNQLDKPEFEIDLEDIMRATIEVWDNWGDRNAKVFLRNAVRAYARQVFQQISQLGLDIARSQDKLILRNITPSTASKVRLYLSSAYFRKGQIDIQSEAVQLDFSSLGDGW